MTTMMMMIEARESLLFGVRKRSRQGEGYKKKAGMVNGNVNRGDRVSMPIA